MHATCTVKLEKQADDANETSRVVCWPIRLIANVFARQEREKRKHLLFYHHSPQLMPSYQRPSAVTLLCAKASRER